MAETKRTKHNPVQEAADVVEEEEEKKHVNLEVLEDVEETAQQPVYQIRPQLHEKYINLSHIHDTTYICSFKELEELEELEIRRIIIEVNLSISVNLTA